MKRLLLILSFFPLMATHAQSDKPLRVEIELPRDATDYKVIPLGNEGVATFYEGQGNHPDSSSWVFTLYDTLLIKQKNLVIRTPANLLYTTSLRDGKEIHLLFCEKFQKKTGSNSYFLSVDPLAGNFSLRLLEGFHDEKIYFMEKVEDCFFMVSQKAGGNKVYRYGFADPKPSPVMLCPEPIQSIEFCEVDTFTDRIAWGLVLELSPRNTVMHYLLTDYEGNVLQKTPFPRYSGFNYMTSRIAHVDSGRSLILGTYIRDDSKSNLPAGIYAMKVEADVPSEPDFFSNSQIKSQDSSAVKPLKNEQNLQTLVGGIKKAGEDYALILETFYPEYEYSSAGYGYDPFYSGMPTANFLGYRFVHATVAAFNKEGKLAWSQYLPFRDLLTSNLNPRVSTFNFEGNTVIYYQFNSTLTYMMVDRFEVVEPLNTQEMVLSKQDEMVEYSRNTSITNWYGNSFLLSGYQYLKGKARQAKVKRYVFYMNKMEFR